jgi:hypothetical protein
LKIKTVDIRAGLYNAVYKGQREAITIDNNDLQKAIDDNIIEERSFQGDLDELIAEWNNEPDFKSSAEKQKKYHTERIATFIILDLLEEPIYIYEGISPLVKYLDGGHRIAGAKYWGLPQMEAIAVKTSGKELTGDEKNKLWQIVKSNGGDFVAALKVIGYDCER